MVVVKARNAILEARDLILCTSLSAKVHRLDLDRRRRVREVEAAVLPRTTDRSAG